MTAPSSPGRLCPICGAQTEAALCPTDQVPTIRADLGAPVPDDALGQTIAGRFRVDRLLGEGASGRVYAATQLSVGRVVALKLLQPHRRPDRHAIRRFYREARAATKLASEHVVRVFDFGVDDARQVPFIAMELVEGETLRDLLAREHALPPDRAAALGAQIATALAEAAEAGLVHRDLKPANILVRPDPHAGPRLKVGDFGVAKDLARDDTETLTAEGAAIGTPGYMSPEQLSGHAVGPASDLYALGCILYEVLSGRRPFAAEGRAALMMDHLLSPPPPLPDPLPSGASPPPELAALLASLLAKRPEDRPTSAREVALRLTSLSHATALDAPARPSEPSARPEPPPPSRPRSTETGLANAPSRPPSTETGLAPRAPEPPPAATTPPRTRRLRLSGLAALGALALAIAWPAPSPAPQAPAAPPPSAPSAPLFDQLIVRGGASRVVLHHGPPRPMRVDGDPARVLASQDGLALTLAITSPEAPDPGAAPQPPEIHLWSPNWRRLQIAGSSTVVSADPLPIIDLSLALSGSARAELEVSGQTLTTSIRGSCEAILTGSILHHEGRVGGAARLDAARLETRSTALTAAGTSEASVFARELLDARNESTGEITYRGAPAEVTRAGTGIRAAP